MKVNRQRLSAPRLSAPRLSHMGIVAHRRKIPFEMREVPVQEVMGTIAYGHINPTVENAYMRRLTARKFVNHQKHLREKMIKEDIRHEREVARLMEEARRKNEENAEVNAEVSRMMHEANMENMEKAMKNL
jgi:urease gamma subunit